MENNPTYLFVVAAALKAENAKFLVQRRPEGRPMAGLWEFPGGKVDVGEIPENALSRELMEELGIHVDAEDLTPITFASEPLGSKHLILLLYICEKWSGEVKAIESPELAWVTLTEMRLLQMPPADEPFIDMLATVVSD